MATQVPVEHEPVESDTNGSLEELRRAKNAAEVANARKSVLLADVSHELRTPLQGILSSSRLGRYNLDRSDDEKIVSYFKNIEKCGNVLLKLVNHILDVAKLECEECETRPRVSDLTELVQGVIQELGDLAEEQGITIRLFPTNSATSVLIDQDRIAHVLRNLLSNAINVSQVGGSIFVLISSSECKVTVRVVDEGPGIPNSELATVFERYVQSGRTIDGGAGTGLGLAICLKTVTQHGGRMWAENREFRGAIVGFELPRYVAPDSVVHQFGEGQVRLTNVLEGNHATE